MQSAIDREKATKKDCEGEDRGFAGDYSNPTGSKRDWLDAPSEGGRGRTWSPSTEPDRGAEEHT